MIKFFQKIRLDLMSKNQTGKYLKYAIGEIVLVIVGILMALQINNWNEGRKLVQNVERLMTVFESELEANIESCSSLIRHGYRCDSVATLFVNGKLIPDMLRENRDLVRYLGFGTSSRRFIDDNLDEIIATEKQLPAAYAQLIPDLKELKRRIESQRKWEQVAIDISISSKKEMTLEFPWYQLRDSLSRELRIEHYLTDPIYKGRVLHYNDYQLGENVWDATLIRTSSIALLWKIREMRGTAPPTIEGLLRAMDLKPFQALSCDAYPFEPAEEIHLHANFIMYNNRSDTVYFNVANTEGRILNSDEWSLAPHSFQLDEWSLSIDRSIEVLDGDSCHAVYRRTKEDYLIIN
jgi:hypothetical protein